jgi:hypothetical protein
MVTKYVVDRQTQGAANATINREQSALKRMYRLAAEKLGGYCPPIRALEENNVRQASSSAANSKRCSRIFPQSSSRCSRSRPSPAGGSSQKS